MSSLSRLATFCLFLSMFHATLCQDKDFSVLHRNSLQEYSLAKCTDGSPAAYYADRVSYFFGNFSFLLSNSGANLIDKFSSQKYQIF